MDIVFGVLCSLIIAGLFLWAVSSKTKVSPMLPIKPPRFMFAKTDIDDVVESALGKPGAMSMVATSNQEFKIKITGGHEYTGVGPTKIIIIPEDT